MAADVPGVRACVAVGRRVAGPVVWLEAARDPDDALWIAVQLAVRDAFTARELERLVSQRGEVATELGTRVSVDAERLGIEVLRVEIRDLAPPPEVRRAALAPHTARAEGRASWNAPEPGPSRSGGTVDLTVP